METAESKNFSTAVVNLAEDDQGLAPGQYAAFYQDGVCLGSGIIFEALGEEMALNVSVEALAVAKQCSIPQFLNNRNGSKKKAGRIVTRGRAAVGSVEQSLGSSSSIDRPQDTDNDIRSSRKTGLQIEKDTKQSAAGMWPFSLLSRLFSWLRTQ